MLKALNIFFVRLPALLGDALSRLRPLSELLAFAALILLGVHGAADLLDDLFFVLIDHLDHGVDALVRALLQGLAAIDLLSLARAEAWADAAALWIDIDRKEAGAVGLALLAELALGLLLLRWCWVRDNEAVASVASEVETTGLHAGLLRLRDLGRLAPGALRGLSLVLAFALGAFGLGRWATVRLSLIFASASGEVGANLARGGGVLLGGLALLTVLPLVLRRAVQRSRGVDPRVTVASALLPLLVAALFVAAVIRGGPGQALRSLLGQGS